MLEHQPLVGRLWFDPLEESDQKVIGIRTLAMEKKPACVLGQELLPLSGWTARRWPLDSEKHKRSLRCPWPRQLGN